MIVINARFLTQKITGVQRYAIEICKRFPESIKEKKIILVAPKGELINKEELKFLKIEQFGNFRGHLWEQIDLVNFLNNNKNPILINFGGIGPLYYKNKITSNIGFKIINLYNDLFRIDGNNAHNSIKYKNDCLYIGKNNETSELSNSFMHLNGSCSSSIITVNCERYYVTNEDNTILADTSKNDITLILNNGKCYYGRIYNIKHIKTQIQHNSTIYKLTINSTTSIDGKNVMILDKINEYIRIQSDSENWYII